MVGGLNAQSNDAISIDKYPPFVGISPDSGNFMGTDSSVAINFILERGLTTTNGTHLPLSTYVVSDNYLLYLLDGDCGPFAASCKFTRPSKVIVDSNLIVPIPLIVNISSNQLTTIPRIRVEAQTKMNGSYISDVVFTIYDEFTYYNSGKIYDNTCKSRNILDPKITIFRECCPYIVSVVSGKGVTLWDKIRYLCHQETTGSPNVYIFYENMMLYGMAKYILARLLWGKFRINYLLFIR